MSQTSYAINQSAALEGQLFDLGENDVLSFNNPAVAMPFGKLAIRAAGDDECALPTVDTDITDVKKVLGMAMAVQSMESSISGSPQYPIQSQVSVLRKGRAWVKVEEAVTPADAVVVRHAAGGLGIGSFAKTDGASHALLAGAKYLTSAGINGLAVIEFNL